MSKKEEKGNVMQEESGMTLPDDAGQDHELNLEGEQNEEKKKEEEEAIEAIRKFTNEDDDELSELSIKSILGGDFLMSKFMIKQIMFVVFCVALMLIYTGNRYDSQQDAVLIDSLRGRLQDVKYNVLTQSSELMNLTRQSNVEKRLRETPDSLLHNSITPPYLIKGGNGKSASKESKIEEVVVDSAILIEQMNETDEEEEGTETKEKASGPASSDTQTSADRQKATGANGEPPVKDVKKVEIGKTKGQ